MNHSIDQTLFPLPLSSREAFSFSKSFSFITTRKNCSARGKRFYSNYAVYNTFHMHEATSFFAQTEHLSITMTKCHYKS